MVFEFIKNFHKQTMKNINDEWDSMEPERLHKQAFQFLQKEFGAFQYLTLDSVTPDLKQTEEICKEGGNIYDICWDWYFSREIMFSGIGSEPIDNRKMLIYDSCKFYYKDKKFALATTYQELETYIDEFENSIPPEFSFKKLERE